MTAFRRRSFVKAFSWRILASTDTFLISWLITGRITWAGTITLLEIVTKTLLYYFHERGWNKVKWGRMSEN
tara:strand:+ start:424 stop:636 length:213 start_codon:yes stop_codon:yes gene_type:complete